MKYAYKKIHLFNINKFTGDREEFVNKKVNEVLEDLNIDDNKIITVKVDTCRHIDDIHLEVQIFYKG